MVSPEKAMVSEGFPYWAGMIQPGAVVGIYENDEAAKTVTELFTKAVELGGDTPTDGSDLVWCNH